MMPIRQSRAEMGVNSLEMQTRGLMCMEGGDDGYYIFIMNKSYEAF